jgi:4-amino-4-deoxychorismate mutase
VTVNPKLEFESGDIGFVMERCRERLDQLDTTLIALIAERMRLCAEIARLKREGNIAMMQPHRLQHVRTKSVKEGRRQGLDERFVNRLIDVITQESCRLEDLIIEE